MLGGSLSKACEIVPSSIFRPSKEHRAADGRRMRVELERMQLNDSPLTGLHPMGPPVGSPQRQVNFSWFSTVKFSARGESYFVPAISRTAYHRKRTKSWSDFSQIRSLSEWASTPCLISSSRISGPIP